MVNYSNSKIYKLVNNVDDEIYIGSTVNPLFKRKYEHKREIKMHPQLLKSQHFLKVGWENVQIILIEEFPCDNREQLLKRERFWIDELRPSLNRNKPYISTEEKNEREKNYKKEYHQRNDVKSRRQEYQKEYRKQDYVKLKMKEYKQRRDVKIRAKEYREREDVKLREKNYKKEYREREDVKLRVKNYAKEYYKKHKKELITCDCGVTIKKYHLSQHLKSNKHLEYKKIYDFIYS